MYRYDVEYWDNDIKEPNSDQGLVAANSYLDAAQLITEQYGENNIVTLSLTALNTILTEENIIEEFKRKEN